MRIIFTLILIILLFIPLISADEYPLLGNPDGYFAVGSGSFNSELTSDTLTGKNIVDGKEAPLIADLDQDGTNELIIVDGGDIRLYDSDLDPVDAYGMYADERISNIQAFNIDDDAYIELIVFYELSEVMDIIEYNGTIFTNTSSFKYGGAGHTDGETMIRCGAINECLMVFAEGDNFAQASDTYAVGFNSTAFGSPVSLITEASTNSLTCMPKIRFMAYNDTDNDGDNEYIATVLQPWLNDKDHLWVFKIDVNNTYLMGVTLEDSNNFDTISPLRNIDPTETLTDAGYRNCYDIYAGNFFTSPLVFDMDASPSNGLETVIGIAKDDEEFNMISLDSDLDQEDDYPEFWNADGQIMSNVMLMDVFSDTGTVDFCVLGHDNDAEELDLLCGSEQSGATYESYEFKYSTDGKFNITLLSYRDMAILSHASQHSAESAVIGVASYNNPDEIITSYGVLMPTGNDFNGSSWIFDLDLLFEFPIEDHACVPVDMDGIGAVDMFCLDDTTLYKIDDGLASEGALITNVDFNPCPIDTIIKVNETIEVYVTVTDQNNPVIGQDRVNVRVYFYYNHNNEMMQNMTNMTSGSIMPFSFTLNDTITGGTIYIEGWDEGSPDEIDTITITPFTVALNGVEFGDVECSIASDAAAEAEEEEDEAASATLTEDAANNGIITGMNTLSNSTGLSGTTIFLIIMIVMSIGVWFEMAKRGFSGSSALGMAAILNVLMIILGVRVGIFSAAMVVIIALIAIVILGVFLGRFITGLSNN